MRGPGPAEELRQIEEQMDRQGIDYPAFLERDAELLSGIIMGQEPYGEQDKAGRKQGTGETVSGEKAKLEVFCLGSFTVKAGGVTLVWRTRKSRELFACLFVQNGKGLDQDKPDLPAVARRIGEGMVLRFLIQQCLI